MSLPTPSSSTGNAASTRRGLLIALGAVIGSGALAGVDNALAHRVRRRSRHKNHNKKSETSISTPGQPGQPGTPGTVSERVQ